MAAPVESCKRKEWAADDFGVGATLRKAPAFLFLIQLADRLKNEVVKE